MGSASSRASAIRYALTPRPAPDGAVDVVLDLFRGTERALTRTIALVRPHELAPVVLACRRYLERRGARAASHRAAPAAPEPAWAAPVAAFDWLFAG